MRSIGSRDIAIAAGAVLAFVAAAGIGGEGGGDPHVTFDDVRMRDSFAAWFEEPGDRAELELYAGAGSKVTITAQGERCCNVPPAAGLALTLLAPDGSEVEIPGNKDRSDPERERIRWNNVKLEQTGTYALTLCSEFPGGWTFETKGSLKKIVTKEEDEEPLPIAAEASVEFMGYAGGRVVVTLKRLNKSGFKGQILRVEREDGSVVFYPDEDGGGRIDLDRDGLHRVFFTNVGDEAGAWRAEVDARTPSVVRRRGVLEPDGVVWQPRVDSVKPRRAFHLENGLEITLEGREFQPGADVRLTRKGREDILGTDVRILSPNEIAFTVDLNTTESQDGRSVGTWKVGVWNDPQYRVPDDRTTLIKDEPARDDRRKFESLSNADIHLADGTEKDTEVWVLEFGNGFQQDLDAMGLGSADPVTREKARAKVEAYVILFVRDLFRINETDGRTPKLSIPLCFPRSPPPAVAGAVGTDYNRITIGGAWQAGDPQDPDETLRWGFVPFDPGNTVRHDLAVQADDGTRTGLGVRLRFLDTTLPEAARSWKDAMKPLQDDPLWTQDRKYFEADYFPNLVSEALRNEVIVNQIERAAREIAAVVAHHIAKAQGVDDGGEGPTQNPTVAGEMWPTRHALGFTEDDLDTMREIVVPHTLPGRSNPHLVTWFPLVPTIATRLPDATTNVLYSTQWGLVGGRPNALEEDYLVRYTNRSDIPLGGFELSFQGIEGTAPLTLPGGRFYCAVELLHIQVDDTRRDRFTRYWWRLNVLPNVPELPPDQQQEALICADEVQNR